jgi:arylsulfatase A-like enzyme
MKRRTFIQTATAGLAGLALGGCDTRINMPHVMLITMDTTTRQHLSCYGYERETSPNLDAFAEEAILFEDFYSNTNITLPGHAALLTGLYPHSNGVIIQQPLNKNIPTLATLLKAKGYQTGAVTSSGLLTKDTIGQGFDYFSAPVRSEQNRAAEAFQLARQWLDSVDTKRVPVFLWVHLIDPHTAYDAPPPFSNAFLDSEKDKKRLQEIGVLSDEILNCGTNRNYNITEDDQRLVIAKYDGEIAYMDAEMGKFFSYLKQKNIYEKTIMAVTADHGETMFQIDKYWSGHHFINEPTMQIPLIIRHPDYAAQRVKGLAQQIDLLPTLLEWLKLDALPLDGKSMVPAIDSRAPVREQVYYTQDAGRYLGATDGKTKIRRLYWKQETFFKAPEQWYADASSKPNIKFASRSFQDWKFSEHGGSEKIEWECPEACAERLHDFKMQFVIHPDRFDGEIVSVGSEHFKKEGRTGTMTYIKPSPRFWNHMHQFGRRLFRVIAVDDKEEIIAASEVVYIQVDSAMETVEVYDLEKDPNERHNIARENPSRASELMSKLDSWAIEGKQALKEMGSGVLSDDLREALESLGYLE